MSKVASSRQPNQPSIEFSVELMSRKELMEYLNDIRRTLNSLDLKFIMMNLERRHHIIFGDLAPRHQSPKYRLILSGLITFAQTQRIRSMVAYPQH